MESQPISVRYLLATFIGTTRKAESERLRNLSNTSIFSNCSHVDTCVNWRGAADEDDDVEDDVSRSICLMRNKHDIWRRLAHASSVDSVSKLAAGSLLIIFGAGSVAKSAAGSLLFTLLFLLFMGSSLSGGAASARTAPAGGGSPQHLTPCSG